MIEATPEPPVSSWARDELAGAGRELLDHVTDYAIFLLDAEGFVRTWNVGAARMKGFRAEEIIGKHFSVFYPPEARRAGHPQRELDTARRDGRYEEESIRVRKDGSHFVARVVITAIYDPAGQVTGFSKVTRDVSAERAVESRIRRLYDANVTGVFVADAESIVEANDYFLGIVGARRSDLDAGLLDWRALTPAEWHAADARALGELVERGVCAPYEKEFRGPGGRRCPVLTGAALNEASPLTWTCFVLDLSGVKKAEWELRQAQASADRANSAKNEFLSRMSHELRTPLNAIIGFSEVLKLEGLGPQQQEPVDQILRGGQHLLDLINEVLDISRIEGGHVRLSLEPVSVGDVIDEALRLVRHLSDARSVRLPVVPAGWCDVHVLADRQRLKQVALNLLSNAVKYNRPAGEVTVTCEASGPRARVTVGDTGPGIDPADMERLFTPFDRLGVDESEVEGTGLGLALTKRLVEAMGGSIGVTSVPGRGSTFWFDLDRAEHPAERWPDPAGDAETEDPTPATAARGTVLYIEDNLSNVSLVRRILASRRGIELEVAMQASLGLELTRARRPDVILLDLHLPDLPGEEVLRRLHGDPETAAIPVYVVSADATPGQVERIVSSGAAGYLTKPLSIRQFLDIIDRHCTPPAGPDAGAGVRSPSAPAGAAADRRRHDATGVLDPGIIAGLHDLAAAVGDGGVAALVESVLDEATTGLARLVVAVAAGDADGTAEAAHAVRGSAATYGAARLADGLAAVEALASDGHLDEVPGQLGLLHVELARASEALRGTFGRGEGGR